jgi:hypothetical protein
MKRLLVLQRDSGQGMVEFALVFPIFITILLFIIEAGWMTYQQTVFDQSYQYSSWTIGPSDLGDYDPLDSCPSHAVYNGNTVAEPFAEKLKEASFWGFIPENLTVSNAQAEMHNEEDTFSVPGRAPGDAVTAISRTRYMKLEATLSYDIYPLTFLGRQVFGDRVTKEKKLSCNRIAATQHRSE